MDNKQQASATNHQESNQQQPLLFSDNQLNSTNLRMNNLNKRILNRENLPTTFRASPYLDQEEQIRQHQDRSTSNYQNNQDLQQNHYLMISPNHQHLGGDPQRGDNNLDEEHHQQLDFTTQQQQQTNNRISPNSNFLINDNPETTTPNTTAITNGHLLFNTDDQNQQQQYDLHHHHQYRAQHLNQQQQDNKLYTDMDQQTVGQKVRFTQQSPRDPLAINSQPVGPTYANCQQQISAQQQDHQNIIQSNETFIDNHVQMSQQQQLILNDPQHLYRQQQLLQDNTTALRPLVEIVEQPARCALRFRYKCEGRSAGSLPGANSSVDNKTFPSIRIANYRGRAVVVISCVTSEEPFKAHPHNIVGREGCKKGICTIVIKQNEPNSVRSFPSLGIQCVKRRDIEESLSLRESINVDPFRQGFEHKHNSSNLDLNVVRLCFQVFIEGATQGKCDVPLMPIVSNQIHDKKAMSDLVITKLSHCSAPATGGREVILLCDRITKDDIKIRFYEERNGHVHWESYYEPSPADIHKQVAICFKTPKYHNENIQHPVMVRIQLKRMSDNQVSESRPFQFLPCESDEDIIHRKRQKIDWVNPDRYALN